MYRMEQYALSSSDVVLAQSRSMGSMYTRAYGLRPLSRVVLATPPMERVLAPLEGLRASLAALRPSTGGIATRKGSVSGAPLLLVYGKLQLIKGTRTVAAALAALATSRPDLPFRAVFVGGDTPCPQHGGRLTSDCVKDALASLPHGAVSIRKPVPRDGMPDLLRELTADGLVAAIMASVFETFSMAAHELARAGVPLVLSDIDAFSPEYWPPGAAYRFRMSNATSLAATLEELLSAPAPLEQMRSMPPLSYGDALAPYARIIGAAREGNGDGAEVLGPAAGRPLQLIDAAVRIACAAVAERAEEEGEGREGVR